jgi:SMODS-associated NUDIX domain
MHFAEGFAEALLAELCVVGLTLLVGARLVLRDQAWPLFRISVVHRRRIVRFSASAILHVCRGSERLLAVTPQRGDAAPYWAPLGGVLKYRSDAQGFLQQAEIQQHISAAALDDMARDLRVVMPARAFFRFLRWFRSGDGRESPTEALCREMKEELREYGLPDLASRVEGLEARVVKLRATRVLRDTAQKDLYHYRLFYVCELIGDKASAFVADLLDSTKDGFELVPDRSICAGEHHGVAVGSHSVFLFADGPYRLAGGSGYAPIPGR